MKNNVNFSSNLAKFGIGVFETIKVDKSPIDIDIHIERMFNSLSELNILINNDKEFYKEEILKYIKENNIENKALRLTVFDEGYNISIRNILYNKEMYEVGFRLNISPIRRGDSIIHRHKTTNYFENIYTKNYATENGYDDGIFLDAENNVLECSMSNIFFIKDKQIFTISDKFPILSGTVKRRIIEICGELNIQLVETNINIDEIKEFDFVFITNSIIEMMKVIEIEGIKFNNRNELFDKITKAYKDKIYK